jgi:hypothetical protein
MKSISRQFASRFSFFLLLVLSFCSLPASRAQFLDQGGLTGVVQDASGGVIPGAVVTLTNPETAFTQTTKTNGSGVYVFSPLKIGTYVVTVKAQGFQQTIQQNIAVNIGQRSNINVTLKPGGVSESVTVTDAPPLLQTQDSSTGQTFTSQEINETPLNSRNAIYLAQLAPGVTPSNGSRARGTGDFDANGMRAEQNNFVLDGVDNNTVTVDFLGGTSYVINPPPDALQQFKVSTSNYSAEYGHSAGALVSASVKSGTDQIHGDVWEYLRNDFLDTHDWVTAPSAKTPEYRQNLFGATLGLPIIKNRLFFFGDVQNNRIIFVATQTPLSVPTLAERTGDFSQLLYGPNYGGSAAQSQILYQPQNNQTVLSCPARAGSAAYTPPATLPNGQATVPGENILCPNQIDPVAQAILNMYPLPNSTTFGIATQNYTYTLHQPQFTFQWDARMDWNITKNDQAFARFSYLNQRGSNDAPLGPVLDGGGGNGATNVSGLQLNYGNNFVFSETHVFSPNKVNEFRFAYDYGHFAILNPGYNLPNEAASLGLGGVPEGPGFPNNGGLPTVSIGGIAAFGSHAYRPENELENEYQILDNFAWNLGNHSIRLGFSYQTIRSYTGSPSYSHPTYTYGGTITSKPGTTNTGYGVADFLTNNMSSGSISPYGVFNDAQNLPAAYVQDDWRVTRKLTVNLGVRYEYFQPYKEMAGQQANFVADSTGVSTGTGEYILPARDRSITLNPAFLNVLAKDHIQLEYWDNDRLTNPHHLNFAPRVGFAYSATPRTIVRGGFGLFYQGQQSAGGAVNLGTNYPFLFNDNFLAPSCPTGSACQNNGYSLETGFSNAIAQGLTSYFVTPGLIGQSKDLKSTYAEDYTLALEQAFTNDFVFTLSYVGTGTRHLATAVNENLSTVLLPSGSAQAFLPFPDFGGTTNMNYIGNSEYNSLQAKLQKRISHGLDFAANYTWSHAMDDAGNPLGNGIGAYRNSSIIPIRQDLTDSGFDTRHRFTFNGFYRLPFGRGESHLSHSSYVVDALLGGWSTNVTWQIQTGQPFSVGTANQTNVVGGSAYAIRTANPYAGGGSVTQQIANRNPNITCPATVKNKTHWFNPCAFSNPLPASLLTPIGHCPDPTVACDPTHYPYPTYIGDATTAKLFLGSRSDQLHGPGFQRLDMSAFKHFTTFKAQYLELRADVFNLTNSPLLGQPSGSIAQTGGQITTARQTQLFTPNGRFFQISGKYVF